MSVIKNHENLPEHVYLTITINENKLLNSILDLDLKHWNNKTEYSAFFTGSASWGSKTFNDIDIVCLSPIKELLIYDSKIIDADCIKQSKYFTTSFKLNNSRINIISLESKNEYYQWLNATLLMNEFVKICPDVLNRKEVRCEIFEQFRNYISVFSLDN